MRSPPTNILPALGETDSRAGVRSAVGKLYDYLRSSMQADYQFKTEIAAEIVSVYGEASYSPGALANGAQAVITITVAGAALGYEVSAAYDKDLQGLVMGVPYVSALDTTKIVLFNNTGGPITLTAGKWRVYVKPKLLSA